MSVAIGTLFGEDQRALEDLNLLPEDIEEAPDADVPSSSALESSLGTSTASVIVPSFQDSPKIQRSFRSGTVGGIPWFEEMIEGSRLGRLMRSKRGMGISDDGSTSIEWEISEWHDDDGIRGIVQEDSDSNGHATGKRKRGHQADAESSQKRA